MKLTTAFLLLLLFCATGCRSSREIHLVDPEPVTGAVSLSRQDSERVRTPDYIARYEVGRYVDGKDRDVMHEGHPIYRRERVPRWDLSPARPPMAPGGPVTGLAGPVVQPVPPAEAVAAELQKQRRVSAEFRVAELELAEKRALLFGKIQTLRDNSVELAAAKVQLARMESRAQQLEAEVRRVTEENEALRNASPPGSNPSDLQLLEWDAKLRQKEATAGKKKS